MATVPGIDVSYWDSAIDWSKVRATGQCYMFTKATEGDFYADPTFPTNWSGAKAVGILRGAYHFFRCNVDPKKQSKKFIDYVKTVNDNGELPPVLDLESNDGMTKDKYLHAKTWLDEVEKYWQKTDHLPASTFPRLLHRANANLCVGQELSSLAQYPNQYNWGMVLPAVPEHRFWQYLGYGQGRWD
jgi:GH25 family lysozyme M1 (1,4-beta-N-acetylmuramidase)